MTEHKIGTREDWLAARLELLKAEKELTRRSDELAPSQLHFWPTEVFGGGKKPYGGCDLGNLVLQMLPKVRENGTRLKSLLPENAIASK